MTLSETKKLSKHICRLLKVSEINFPIGRTPKGNLGLVFNANTDDFDMLLDSVPLSTASNIEDENNIELKKMIEKYLFSPEQTVHFPTSTITKDSIEGLVDSIVASSTPKNANPKTKKSS